MQFICDNLTFGQRGQMSNSWIFCFRIPISQLQYIDLKTDGIEVRQNSPSLSINIQDFYQYSVKHKSCMIFITVLLHNEVKIFIF